MKSWRTVWWKLLALIARQCAKRKKKFSQRLHNWFNCTKKNIFSYFIFKSHVCDWFDSSAKLVGILFIFIKQKLFIIFLTPICARDEKEKSSRSMIARVLIGIDRCRHAWKFFFRSLAIAQSSNRLREVLFADRCCSFRSKNNHAKQQTNSRNLCKCFMQFLVPLFFPPHPRSNKVYFPDVKCYVAVFLFSPLCRWSRAVQLKNVACSRVM